MPIYEYKCEDCGAETESLQKSGELNKKKCPKCGGKLKKKISAPAIQFKGSGWYVTDHAKRGGPQPEGSKPKSDKAPAEKKDGEKPSSNKD